MPEKDEFEYEVQLPFGPPPVLPDVEKQLKEYLLCPDRLPIHDYEQAQKYWPRERNPCSLYHFDVAPLGTTLKVDRDPTTGKLLQFREVPVDDMGQTAKNSMSLRRAPGPPSEAVRGSSTNYPFWPGGFPELLEDENDEQDAEIDFVNNLLSVPPGFENGLRFKTDGKTPFKEEEITGVDVEEPPLPDIVLEEKVEEPAVVNLMSLVKQEEDLLGLWKDEAKEDEKKEKEKIAVQKIEVDIDVDVSEVVPKEDVIPVLKITETAPLTGPTRTQYAELLDISLPVTDFDKKIPDMAKKWEFELDTFQKKAILKLEEHANVFVAAHTSAGKTVVAEYAIALSKKHMSRSIYTSPIKALSNQKYRDFKETFGDVGLITGDFQINQTAQCLIMTTEILRSMLYCGSEVIRDLEYVIFDEVHYINDSERGHVWEEVLILLPEHVSIVMLSATVPNTLEFADWVGRTKKKKMYVISTLKRPVPLEHYLYTGSGGKSRNDCFLLLNAEGHFKENGYSSAIEAKQSRHNSAMEGKQSRQTAYGPKQGQGKIHLTAKQETTMWVGFLDFLKKKEKLPVVAFTLSRKRCDGNSENLSSVDLTTTKEKSAIHMFFSRCIQNLKPPDQKLPQVVKLEDLLKRGIGVHHSGILPILKEIVEMLFQRGLVKLLFATETFAMGVNMPARTVVFDSIRKFDGLTMRTLLPAEYIQMAGRAGRRGLDKTGTVIIMCKANVPDKTQLKSMMMGKPTKLESKFRLTYSMILNLFRVEKISVEGMMSHSFKEIGHLSHQKVYEKELKQVEEKIKEMSDNPQQQGIHWKPLSEFYDIAIKYLRLWIDVREHMLSHPKCSKELMPGRVLLVSHQEHVNKLGLLLQAADSGKKVYKVLVLCNSEARYRGFEEDIELSVTAPAREEQRSPLWYKMLGLVKKRKLFVPDGLGGHTVITIKAEDILDIVKHKINLDTNLVYQDWDKRQIPRFRDCPPGQTCSQAVQKLTEFTQNVVSETVPLDFVSPTKDIKLSKEGILEDLKQLDLLEKKLNDCSSVNIANFEQLFEDVFQHKQLEEQKKTLQFNKSLKSLSLYPEFENRVIVLQRLDYIDSKKAVKLKGRVACEMGNHELMITEIVLRDILTNKQPAEIAALLSCLVFQQRTESESELTETLMKGIQEIMEVAETLKFTEQECGVGQQDSNEEFEKLNFGLVHVVYQWALKKPFSEIMELTDVQEGIIVRCIQQLNETLRDVKNAAHVIGNPILKEKMQEASDAIKRDIVFAASLYTSEENNQLRARFEEDERLLPVGDE
ncbi:superkiller complex protein 2 [Periplaneta americana]|uniref:superkiller complex protein 2 n=1 Tax=Periplaneta americana TaxID=6978 RepID=UPI0037E9598F